MTLTKIIHDVASGEIVEVALTAAEVTALEKEWAKEAKRIKEEETEADAKETAKAALLTKLGITAEEARLLLS